MKTIFLSAIGTNDDPLKQESFTFYTTEDEKEFERKYGLIKDEYGTVEVLKPFWNMENETFTSGRRVNAILNYADKISHHMKFESYEDELKQFLELIKSKVNEKS